MIGFLFVALLQATTPAAPADADVGVSESNAETTSPAAPAESETPPIETTDPAPAAEPTTRVERRCTRERTGGSTRTARAVVCRDVTVTVNPSEENAAQ